MDAVLCFIFTNEKSSPWGCSVKSVFKNFANFTGKHLCWNLFLMKFLTFRHYSTGKDTTKVLQHRCFPVKYVKFLRTTLLKNIY